MSIRGPLANYNDVKQLPGTILKRQKITAHRDLRALTDDDHTQYLNTTRHDADDHSGLTVDSSHLAGLGAWTSYSPTLSADTTNPNLGSTGTTEGYYVQLGKTVVVKARATFGGTGITNGSGNYRMSLPFAAKTDSGPLGTARMPAGGYAYDASSGVTYTVSWRVSSGNALVVGFLYNTASTYAYEVGFNHTFLTWAAGDVIHMTTVYETD